MKPIFAALCLLIVTGCESTPHYNRTKIVVFQSYPKKEYGTVQFFASKADVSKPYDVIALMSVEGGAGDEAAFIKAFLYRAADIGADGIIAGNASLVAGQEVGGWFVGAKGGFGLPTSPGATGVYKAEAIRFK